MQPCRSKVLIIDDDDELNSLLTEYLGKFGFVVTTASDPDKGLRLVKSQRPDLIILDVMLPMQDGFAVCRKVRETSTIPIIMLTARGDVTDRIVGLEFGADDYVAKPFEPRELVARIQAVLRRGAAAGLPSSVRLGGLEVNWDAFTASLDGRSLSLTTAEFELLRIFIRNRGRVLSRQRILDDLRGVDWDAFDRSVDILVSRLRHKLRDDPKASAFIKTVWGAGYVFIGGDRDDSA